MIVLRKQVSVTKGQRKLIDDSPFFFYITNVSSTEKSAEEIVLAANKRCDQENIISQGKQMGAFAAPLHSTISNGAYMVMASLAWNLKCWLALSLKETGRPKQKAKLKSGKTSPAADGLQHLPTDDDSDSHSNHPQRSTLDLPPARMVELSGNTLPPSGLPEPAAANLRPVIL
jgi:hypothetical protein